MAQNRAQYSVLVPAMFQLRVTVTLLVTWVLRKLKATVTFVMCVRPHLSRLLLSRFCELRISYFYQNMPTQSRFRLKSDKNDILHNTHFPSTVSGHYWSLLALRPKKSFHTFREAVFSARWEIRLNPL